MVRHLVMAALALPVLGMGGAAGARPLVAIIDSGVALTPELQGVVKGEVDTAVKPGRVLYQPHYDHGTMVATIVAREAQRQVDIVSFRIDDPAGCPEGRTPPCQPSATPVVRAIEAATRMHADIINLSLTLGGNPRIVEAVHRATARGITVIMAAGNAGHDHPDNRAMARAGYPNAILVGALDGQGQVWSGTNRPEADARDYVYVWRTGVSVPTMSAAGQVVYGTGTSFAAPIETGRRALALVKAQAMPTRTFAQRAP